MLCRFQEDYAGSKEAKLKAVAANHLREDSGLGQDGNSRCDEKWLDSGDNLEMASIKSLMHWA